MHIVPTKSKLFRKVFRSEAGEFILATFEVFECGGRLKGRLVGTEIVSSELFEESPIKILPLIRDTQEMCYPYTPTCHDTISPFFDFSFLLSQPTRAPSR